MSLCWLGYISTINSKSIKLMSDLNSFERVKHSEIKNYKLLIKKKKMN